MNKKKNIIGYCMLFPFLAHFVLFMVYPYITTFIYSFSNKDFRKRTMEFVGFANYKDVFQDSLFYKVLENTAIWQIFVPIGCVVLGLALALLLNRKLKGTAIMRVSFYIPSVLDWVAVSVAFIFILNTNVGIVNPILMKLGFPPQRLLDDPKQALPIMILITYWKSAGYYSVFYLAALQDVNPNLLEAASIDGANAWQRFANITLPQIAPVTVVVVVMAWANSIKLIEPFYAMTLGGPARATTTLILYFHEIAFGFLRIGKGSAVAVIFTLIVFVAVVFQRIALNRMKGAEGSN